MALTKLGKTWYDANVIDNVLENDEMVVTSRYSTKTNLLRKDGNTVIRNLRTRDFYIPESDEDTVHKIKAGEEFRPDVVAFNQYGDASLYWVVLSANRMKDIFEFKADKVIRLPEITRVYSSNGVLGK